METKICLLLGVEQHKSITKFKNPDYDSTTINNDVCLLKVQHFISNIIGEIIHLSH